MARLLHSKHTYYVVISNEIAQSTSLSFRAKGLMAYLLSLPDDFVIKVNYLAEKFIEGRHVIYQTIDELKRAGYLDDIKRRDDNGKIIACDYGVYDVAQPDLIEKFESKNQDTENQEVDENRVKPTQETDFQEAGNQHQAEPLVVNQPLKNKYNKKINNITKTAAAIASTVQSSIPREDSGSGNSAAAFHDNESHIGEDLTQSQAQRIWRETRDYCQRYRQQVSDKSPEALYHEICNDMLNPKSWTRCGNDFDMKLNVIKKQIRSGKWETPAGMATALTTAGDTSATQTAPYTGKVQSLVKRYKALLVELNMCLQVHNSPLANDATFVALEAAKASKHRKALASLEQQLRTYGVWKIVQEQLPNELTAVAKGINNHNPVIAAQATVAHSQQEESSAC